MNSHSAVFLVHGRDALARDAIRELLQAMGLKVVTWSDALSQLPLDQHDIWRVVRKGFELAHAAVVVSTPDEIAFLRPELQKAQDEVNDRGPRYQSRQNVLLELGYSLYGWEQKTLQIAIGPVKPPSDRSGKWTVALSDPSEAVQFREQIAGLLKIIFSETSSREPRTTNHDDFLLSIERTRKHWIAAGAIERLAEREASRQRPSFIEGGTDVKLTRFRFKEFFSTGDEFILTGTNFGDQMGDPGTPPGLLHQLIVATLKRNLHTSVYLIIAPFELLESMVSNSIADLKSRSARRLLMLRHDPRLTEQERSRLHIFDHRGATFLSFALRDPNSTAGDRGLVVVTPRWFKDEAGPQRMFFAIEQALSPEVFKAFIQPIYPSIKVEEYSLAGHKDVTMGGRSIDKICSDLNVAEDSFMPHLNAYPIQSV